MVPLQKASYLQLLQAVTAAANEALTIESAMQAAIDQVCFITKWPTGHLYILDEGSKDILIPADIWHLETPEEFGVLRKATAISRFIRGEGLPGRVLASGKPVWIKDVYKDENFPRARLEKSLRIKSCFGFPIMVGTDVVAVLEFFSVEVREPDEPLLEVMAQIGVQLGHVIKRKMTEETLLEQEARFRSVAQSANDAIISADNHGKVVFWNNAAKAMFGYSEEEIAGKPLTVLMPEQYREAHRKGIERVTLTNETRIIGKTVELSGLRKDGSEFPLELSVSTWMTKRGRFFSGIIRDVTERKQAEKQLQHLAHYDGVTGLPNRTLFFERLNQVLSRARWHKRLVAVLFLDLDRFKVINDTFGHTTGDLLLKAVAKRLTDTVREGDIIARFGGDEFAITLVDIAKEHDIPDVVKKIIDAMAKPFIHEGREFFITASIGISIYPDDGGEVEVLLQKADIAMYSAKEEGKNTYRIYSPSMNAMALERLRMETQLRRALEQDEFMLYYQPKVDLSTGHIIGIEALLRWLHPERGLIFPKEFVTILEETGLIIPVGEWVFRTACRQTRTWQKEGFLPLRVAVNLSMRQFNQQNLAMIVRRALNESGLEPGYLEIELTENLLMSNVKESMAAIHELTGMGVQFAVDDFGTGYSSLSYLKRFPLRSLKIDRSFIQDVTVHPDDAAIVKAIISMAHSLNLKVVAEGVETKEQLAFLIKFHCDEFQGYYFSPPLTAEDFAELLREGRFLDLESGYSINIAKQRGRGIA